MKFSQRTFLDNEPDVTKELINLNVKIIFVITRSERPEERSFISYRKTIINEIKTIIKNKNIEPDMVKKAFGDNFGKIIVPVYCRKEKIQGQFVKTFGIDILFNLIYDFLSPYIIDIKKIKEEKDIQKIIDSNFFLRIFESQEKILKYTDSKLTYQFTIFILKMLVLFPKIIYSKLEEVPEESIILFLELVYNNSKLYLINFNISEALTMFKNHVLPMLLEFGDEKNLANFKKEFMLDIENDDELTNLVDNNNDSGEKTKRMNFQ